MAYRIRASFLPGEKRSVQSRLSELQYHEIDLSNGAVLETDCVYLVPLIERLKLRPSLFAIANPKSSNSTCPDVNTRLITDDGKSFDYVSPGYNGPLYIEISPRTFSILVRQGSKLNQLRLLRRTPRQARDKRFISDARLEALHDEFPLVDRTLTVRDGVNLRVDLAPVLGSRLIGYKAKRYAGVVDVDLVGGYGLGSFGTNLRQRQWPLNP